MIYSDPRHKSWGWINECHTRTRKYNRWKSSVNYHKRTNKQSTLDSYPLGLTLLKWDDQVRWWDENICNLKNSILSFPKHSLMFRTWSVRRQQLSYLFWKTYDDDVEFLVQSVLRQSIIGKWLRQVMVWKTWEDDEPTKSSWRFKDESWSCNEIRSQYSKELPVRCPWLLK